LEHISFFLKKFENLGAREFLVKEIMSGVIEKKCGIKISTKDIVYDRGTLTVKGSRSLKSELFINKAEIIEEIENALTSTKMGRIL
jgi:hypothetical protein